MNDMRAPKKLPRILGPFGLVLLVFQIGGLVAGAPLLKAPLGLRPKVFFPLLLIGGVVYTIALVWAYRRAERRPAPSWIAGWLLLLTSVLWGVSAVLVVGTDPTSVLPGLFVMSGVVCWGPLFILGWVVLLGSQAGESSPSSVHPPR